MNDISVVIKIVDFDLSFQRISEILNLEPTKTCKKGDKYFVDSSKTVEKIYQTNYWEHRLNIKSNTVWVKEVIDTFCKEKLYPKDNDLVALHGKCRMELSISIWYYNSYDSFHFDLELLNFLAKHQIEIDIDQY